MKLSGRTPSFKCMNCQHWQPPFIASQGMVCALSDRKLATNGRNWCSLHELKVRRG